MLFLQVLMKYYKNSFWYFAKCDKNAAYPHVEVIHHVHLSIYTSQITSIAKGHGKPCNVFPQALSVKF